MRGTLCSINHTLPHYNTKPTAVWCLSCTLTQSHIIPTAAKLLWKTISKLSSNQRLLQVRQKTCGGFTSFIGAQLLNRHSLVADMSPTGTISCNPSDSKVTRLRSVACGNGKTGSLMSLMKLGCDWCHATGFSDSLQDMYTDINNCFHKA